MFFFLIYPIRVGSTNDIASEAGVLWTVENLPVCKYQMAFLEWKRIRTNFPHIESLGGESGWCEVKATEIMTDIKDYQMWKLDENSKTIVSKFNNGIIGIDGNSILSAYIGDGDMVGAVSVDTTTSSNYDFKFTGL